MIETLDYWNKRALEKKDSRAITHYDIHQREFEIEFISKYLDVNHKVLDLGCGNGYTTNRVKHLVKFIKGIDFSNEMITRALHDNIKSEKCNFEIGDARTLNLNEKFNIIITQRCLINILSWEEQKIALMKIYDHLDKNGIYLMFEGSSDGKKKLNELRKTFKLDPIPAVKYNLDFQDSKLLDFMENFFSLFEIKTFGQYEYVTRIIYPCSIFPDKPEYESDFHDIALNSVRNLEDFMPEISKLKLWVWKKNKNN